MDDFHNASSQLVEMMSMLLEILSDHPHPTVLLVSRYLPSFYDRRYVVIKKVVGELQLAGLDRASARTMLAGRGLADDEFERIYSTTKGHPLALELVMQREDLTTAPFKDVMTFIREEVFEGLSEGERRTLAAISIHRANVPREAALVAATGSGHGPEVLDSLVERGLVADVGDEEVRLHDLVREFFSSRLTPAERVACHREAAEAWGRIGTLEAIVERAHHQEQAGEAEAAVTTLAEGSGRVLGEPRLLKDVMAILDAATGDGALSTTVKDEADILRADALAQLDQTDAAHALYTSILDRAVAETDREQEARLLHRIGNLHARRGQVEMTIELQRRAITAYEAVNDEVGAANCHLAIAAVLADQEDHEGAVEELARAHESFTMMKDGGGIAAACTRLASIMLDREDTEVARSYLEEAVENLDPKEDLVALSNAYYLMGEVDRLEEDWDQVVKHLERAMELFAAVDDQQMVANTCNYLGDAYNAIGDEERANMFYQRGLDLMVVQ